MQPYQQEGQRILEQADEPGNVLKNVSGKATALVGGGLVLKKLTPFLSNLIPSSLAVKGISKINPTMGKFIKGAMDQGASSEEAIEFIKEKVQPKSSQSKNIIEEFAPEVHELLVDKVGQGLKPLAVAFQLSQDPKLKSVIRGLEKKTGKAFSDLVSSIFGSDGQSQGNLQSNSTQDALSQLFGQNAQKQTVDPLKQALDMGDAGALKQILNINEKQALAIIQKYIQGPNQPNSTQGALSKLAGKNGQAQQSSGSQALMQALQAAQQARARRQQR